MFKTRKTEQQRTSRYSPTIIRRRSMLQATQNDAYAALSYGNKTTEQGSIILRAAVKLNKQLLRRVHSARYAAYTNTLPYAQEDYKENA